MTSVYYRRLLESVTPAPEVEVLRFEDLNSLDLHPLEDVAANRVLVMAGFLEQIDEPVVTVGEDHKVLDGRHRAHAANLRGESIRVINISQEAYEELADSMPPKSLEEIANWARRSCQRI